MRLRTGWFSDRSATYLASGRPVVTQDTGFGCALPTGSGLFSFDCPDAAMEAVAQIDSDYAAQSRAARELALEHFSHETVLRPLLEHLGVSSGLFLPDAPTRDGLRGRHRAGARLAEAHDAAPGDHRGGVIAILCQAVRRRRRLARTVRASSSSPMTA